jgi:antitoxin component YwqK of YwqJK toxin-antitoxin module
MKKISHLLIFSCLILIELKCSTPVEEKLNKQECICGDLILDELYNHYYLDDREKPFSGTCREYFKNGGISEQKTIKNGKMSGEMIRYREDGSKKTSIQFEDNFIHGRVIFYDLKGNEDIIEYYDKGELITQ